MIKASKLLRHVGRTPELLGARRQTPDWLGVTKRYLEIGEAIYPCQIPLSGGGMVEVHSPGELKVFWQIFVHNCYTLPAQCDTILDAGANVGLFSVWAARERPKARIVALEPFPATFQHLERNIQNNGFQDRIRPVRYALAGTTGPRPIRSGGDSPNKGLVLRGMEDSSDHVIEVPCMNLADFLKTEQFETLDLLKMDIEGSEWEVILSTSAAVLHRIRQIIVEYHEVNARFGYTPAQLIAHLGSAGHRLTHREENAERTGLAFFSVS
jgi:FkbM family methyltransferase